MRTLTLVLAMLTAGLPHISARAQSGTPSEIAGKWHFVFATEGGDREMDADFTVAGGKVGGTFGKSEVKGTVSGEKFDLEFPTESDEVGKGTLKMSGKAANNQLTGSWSFLEYAGTFRGTRPKAEKPAGGK